VQPGTLQPALPEGRAALQRLASTALARKTAMVYTRPFWRDKGLNGHTVEVKGQVLWAWTIRRRVVKSA
jgi:monoamine oxidase